MLEQVEVRSAWMIQASHKHTMSHPFEASEVQAGLQAALVPPVLYSGNSIEAFGRSVPKDEVGEDLADLVSQGQDVIAYVMDVLGHGIRAHVRSVNGILDEREPRRLFASCSQLNWFYSQRI